MNVTCFRVLEGVKDDSDTCKRRLHLRQAAHNDALTLELIGEAMNGPIYMVLLISNPQSKAITEQCFALSADPEAQSQRELVLHDWLAVPQPATLALTRGYDRPSQTSMLLQLYQESTG